MCNMNLNSFTHVREIYGEHVKNKSDEDVKSLSLHLVQNTREFPSLICQKFKKLTSIIIDAVFEHKIEIIDENSFRNCKNLHELGLTRNPIGKVLRNLLASQSKLKILRLAEDNIDELAPGAFDTLSGLKNLSLDVNDLKILPRGIFHKLVKLEYLSICRNDLKTLDLKLFHGLTNLRVLLMVSNQIASLPENLFHDLNALEELWLNNNKLTVLHYDIIENKPNLHVLAFDLNQIIAIDVKFQNSSNLQTLKKVRAWSNDCVDNYDVTTEVKSDMTHISKMFETILNRCFENYHEAEIYCNNQTLGVRKCINDKFTHSSSSNLQPFCELTLGIFVFVLLI